MVGIEFSPDLYARTYYTTTGSCDHDPEGMTWLYNPISQFGNNFNVSLNANELRHRTTRGNTGVSIFNLADYVDSSGNWLLGTSTKEFMNSLSISYLRVYNLRSLPGGVTDGLNRLYSLITNHIEVGSTNDDIVISLEHYKESSVPSTSIYTTALQHNIDMGYGFVNWEVANEPYYTNTGVFNPVSNYITYFNNVYNAAKAVDPNCKLGLAVQRTSSWAQAAITGCAGKYDFVCPHFYAWNDFDTYTSHDGAIVSLNQAVLSDMATLNYYTYQANSRIKPIYETEWRLYSFQNSRNSFYKNSSYWTVPSSVDQYDGEFCPKNGNIVGACHEAYRLIYVIMNGLALKQGSWRLIDNKSQAVVPYGWWQDYIYTVTQPPPQSSPAWINMTGKTSVRYWLKYYFDLFLGSHVIKYTGTSPYISSTIQQNYETGSSTRSFPQATALFTLDGSVVIGGSTRFYVIAVNGSTSDSINFDFTINNFSCRSVSGKQITQSSVEDKWWCDSESDVVSNYTPTWNNGHLTGIIGSKTIVFIRLDGSLTADWVHVQEPTS